MSAHGGAAAALSGVRVVEFGHGVSAPFAARLFADYGADVIKVELPDVGDVARSWGPFPGGEPDLEKSGVFFCCNTNKRSITIDVRTAEGRQTLLALVRWADVFVENQRPGDMREWQMEYDRLAIENPELVMVSITPYGQFGPYADWLGYDLNAYHLTATSSRYCGDPDRAPLEHGTFSADFFGAYAATAWALAALYGRERVGGGQHLDVATAETLAALFPGTQTIGGYAQDGIFGRRSGAMAFGAPGRIFPCSDGFAWVMALETAQWDGLRVAMGDPEWAESEVFRTMLGRAENSDIINALVEQWTLTLPKQVVMDLCQANNCPSTAVYTIDEVVDLPHLAVRGQIEHPVLGTVRVFGAPILLPDCPGGPTLPVPLLGEQTQQILQMLADVESNPGGRHRRRPVGEADVRQDFDSKPHGSTSDPARLPLAGVRVANFAWSWIGPVTGQTLAFLGAEVYKIESHARIDINRTFPPFAEGIPGPDRSLQNHAAWAGNGSVTLNLRDPRGQDLARRIVADCDVVVENFSPGVMDRLHLGYEDMRLVRPDLVYVSMPAAGLFGPMSSVRTYGTSLSSIAGLDSITGYDESGPVTMENAFSDPLGGIIGAIGTLLGLFHRRNTGRGQHVDYSQQDGLLQFMGPALMDYVFNGLRIQRTNRRSDR
jgi:crotonobetainyl-CoA:carnitine CoA-transferase CaiB-like acyl-CoA transferase